MHDLYDDGRDDALTTLTAAAAAAYERVRLEIVMQIPPPARIDVTRLSPTQRGALDELYRAEAALSAYRERAYSS